MTCQVPESQDAVGGVKEGEESLEAVGGRRLIWAVMVAFIRLCGSFGAGDAQLRLTRRYSPTRINPLDHYVHELNWTTYRDIYYRLHTNPQHSIVLFNTSRVFLSS